MLIEIIIPVLIIGGIGLIAGIGLVVASKLFGVSADPMIERVRELLPGANCGACGQTGCDAFAEAVCGGSDINACVPGGEALSRKLSEILGGDARPAKRLTAVVACAGDNSVTDNKMLYEGIGTCKAAKLKFSGQRSCSFSCLGFGDCAAVCPFDAIVVTNGLAVIDSGKCTGCGICVKTCPKSIIRVMPSDAAVYTRCSSKDAPKVSAAVCKVSCVACGLCVKACSFGAIAIKDNLAVIDNDKCTGCGACITACRRKAITCNSERGKNNELCSSE